ASAPAELHPVWPNRLGRVGSRRVLRSKGAFQELRARSFRRSAEGLGNPTVAHRDRRGGTAACWPAVPVAADGLADSRARHRPHRHRRRAEAEDNPAEDNSPLEDKPEMAGRAEQSGSTAREPSLPTPRRRSLVPRWHYPCEKSSPCPLTQTRSIHKKINQEQGTFKTTLALAAERLFDGTIQLPLCLGFPRRPLSAGANRRNRPKATDAA